MSFKLISNTHMILKVDVDTKIGLQDGARNLADLFSELGIKTSFFIAMGPDHSGRALKRLFLPGFLRKQFRSGAIFAYGPITMLYGLILPGPIIAKSAPGLFNRLIIEGHEIGLHGWDHVFWHNHLCQLSAEEIRYELKQAVKLFQQITGIINIATFASPGWQITNQALLAIAEMGMTHISCTRGNSPFRPLVQKTALPLIEIPTTMPTMDEALSMPNINSNNVDLWLTQQIHLKTLNVFTLHAELEGRALLSTFRNFLIRLLDQGVIFIRLIDAARQLVDSPLPAEKIVWGKIPYRAYNISCQNSALAKRVRIMKNDIL